MKGKWDVDTQIKCNHCDEYDSRPHRLLSCSATNHIREMFPEAIQLLGSEKEDWVYLPVSTCHEDYVVFKRVVEAFKLPDSFPVVEPFQSQHVYFTDGGCLHPTMAEARLASWSVVRDFAENQDHARAMTSIAVQTKSPCPLLRPIDLGMVEGTQTISRGESCAVVIACQHALQDPFMTRTDIFTDSKYVVNAVKFLESGDMSHLDFKIANIDLVKKLRQLWDPSKFFINKVRSHVDWFSSDEDQPVRLSMGNFVADRIATLALRRCPKFLLSMANAIAMHSAQEKKKLTEVFSYLVALNKEHKKLEALSKKSHPSSQAVRVDRNLMGDDAVSLMIAYSFQGGRQITLDSIESPALQGSLQGVNLARYILRWAETLTWPFLDMDWSDDVNGGTVMHWGISWFELFMNFLICTSRFCPVRVAGSLGKVQYTSYTSDLARILPSDKRSAMTQATSFQAACRCVESILNKKLFPEDITKGGKSIHRLGFTGQVASLAYRPLLMRQRETIEATYQYIQLVPVKNKLRLPLDRVHTFQDIVLTEVAEPSDERRYKNYKMIYKRRCQP